jgi:adenylate cyclase
LDAATQFQVRVFEEARTSAETLAAQAVALDRTDAEARSAFAAVLLIGHGDHEGARIEVERALALTPHLASAHGVLGAVLTHAGQPKEALASFATYIELDPNHPTMGLRLQQMTAALYFRGEYEAAIRAGNRAIRTYPDCPQVYRWLAAALVRHGRISEAKATVAKALAIAPKSFDMYVRRRVPWMRPRDHAILVDDLVKAGWQRNQIG